MRSRLLVWFTFVIGTVMLCAPGAQAGDFPEWIIADGEAYSKIELYDLEFRIDGTPIGSMFPPTRVDMTGGHVGDEDDWNSGMFTYESSLFNMSGGVVDYLHTYNSSTVNISGGLVSHYGCVDGSTILAYDDSAINIFDGAFLFGGSFHVFDLYNSSVANIYGGDVDLLVFAHSSSTVNVYDGNCHFGIWLFDNGTVNAYGGYIDSYGMEPIPPTSTVNIHGYGFAYNPQARWEFDQWTSKLTGYGPDGTTITYWGLPDPSTSSNVNLIPDFVLGRGVDFSDFAALASAWRSSPGDDNWNQIYDISDPNDDVIDERDLAVICKFWLAGVQ